MARLIFRQKRILIALLFFAIYIHNKRPLCGNCAFWYLQRLSSFVIDCDEASVLTIVDHSTTTSLRLFEYLQSRYGISILLNVSILTTVYVLFPYLSFEYALIKYTFMGTFFLFSFCERDFLSELQRMQCSID